MSRVVVYLDNEVIGKVQEDLMDPGFSSIWIELRAGHQKILVGCTYREHQFMKQKDHSSLTKESQVSRWMIFISQLNKVLATGAEVHTLGDFNIDSKTFDQDRAHQGDLTKAVMDQIVPQGVIQCVKGGNKMASRKSGRLTKLHRSSLDICARKAFRGNSNANGFK